MANVKVNNPIPCFTDSQLENLCRTIADTDYGLKGWEIERILEEMKIDDVDPSASKWKRLLNALIVEQNKRKYGNHVVGLLHRVYSPDRWTSKTEIFERHRYDINMVLAFCGLNLNEAGEVKRIEKVKTLSEAEQRANKLKAKLQGRQMHSILLDYCKAELLQDNYFHAVLEASKSIAARVRQITGSGADGADLFQEVFSLGKSGVPIISINKLANETEESEQKGFLNLLIGIFGMFRNPPAHEPKIEWVMSEEDALDILGIISLVHRKLDKSFRTNNL